MRRKEEEGVEEEGKGGGGRREGEGRRKLGNEGSGVGAPSYISHSRTHARTHRLAHKPEQLRLFVGALFFNGKTEEELSLFLRRQHVMRHQKLEGRKSLC